MISKVGPSLSLLMCLVIPSFEEKFHNLFDSQEFGQDFKADLKSKFGQVEEHYKFNLFSISAVADDMQTVRKSNINANN